jgi:hypothetical protein
MMKPIIAVKSNFPALEAGLHDKIRTTWGQGLYDRAEIRFFLGRPTQEIAGLSKSVHPTAQNSYIPRKDEVILECPDGNDGLVWKTRAICKWFVDKMASHILLVNSESVVYPHLLLKSGFQISDYTGRFNGERSSIGPRDIVGPGGHNVFVHDCYSWARGEGYFLSKQAAMIIAAKTPIQSEYILGSYEDFWVGQTLGPYIQMGTLLSEPLHVNPVEVKQ